MAEETLKDKTAKGLFWGGISTFFQQIVGMVFGIIIARILNPDDYGLVAMLTIFSAIANTIMDSGFTTALINKKTIRHEDYNAVFWFSAFCGIIIYVILFFAAPLIAKFYNQPVLLNLSRVLFLNFLISSLGIAHNALLFKQLKVKQRGLTDVVAVIVSGMVGLILALLGFAFWGLALQLVSQCLTATLLRWYFSNWRPSFSFNFSPIKEMFGFSSKILLNNILGQVNANILSVLLGKFYTETDTGFYSQGYKWMQLGNMVVANMIQGVAQPVLVEVKSDKERQKKVFRKMLRFGAFVSFPALLGLAFVAREFILITVGEKWQESVPYLQILSISTSFSFIVYLYNNLLFSYGKSNVILYGNILFYCLNLSLALCLVSWGIYPMIIGCSFLTIIQCLGWHFCGGKYINIHTSELLRDILPFLLLILLCFVFSWLITIGISNLYILFFTKIIIVILLYIFILWKMKSVILKESLSFLFKMKNNVINGLYKHNDSI